MRKSSSIVVLAASLVVSPAHAEEEPSGQQPPPLPAPAPEVALPSVPTHQPAPPQPPVVPPAQPPPYTYGPIPPGPWGGTVVLDLTTTTAGAGFEVYYEQSKPGRDTPLLRCPGDCRLVLYPGKYHIRITETDTTLAGSRLIDVNRPMSIDFDPDTSAKRTWGLVLGIAGPIITLAGIGMLIGHALDAERDDGRAQAGTVLLLGGLTATPIGWVMFGTSFKPEYDIKHPPDFRPNPSMGTGGMRGLGADSGAIRTQSLGWALRGSF